jgi:putative membrane protein
MTADVWSAWTFPPVVLSGVAVGALVYGRGLRSLWRRGGRGRVVRPWRGWCFWGGLATLVIALVSPVDELGESLFFVHMVQHLLLIMVAAPLVVLGDPLFVSLWALPARWRRRIGRAWRSAPFLRAAWAVVSLAPVAWMLHVGGVWVWHLPALYELALGSESIHALEHATFFVTALLFWWVLFAPRGHRAGIGVKVAYLFAAMLQGAALGAALTFARHPWYSSYIATTGAWGFTPLEDQQLAGLIMWIPAGLIYLAALVPLLGHALSTRDERPARVVRLAE